VPDYPTFMYGPKDGAHVPEMLWALDEIELQEKSKDGIVFHRYVINYDDKSYYYAGAFTEEENDE
jgi:hypothetical protein